MDNVFDQVGMGVEPEVAAVAGDETAKKKAEKADKKKAMLESFKQALADPDFRNTLSTASDSLKVVNSLGFGDSGNIVVDKANAAAGRNLVQTSVIVGYRVQNCGATPIEYQTEEWAKGADGQYVPNKVTKVLAPGATCDLNRAFMTQLCARPEFSFKLANGHIMRGSGANTHGDARKELEAYYFAFEKDADVEINSDDIKLQIGVKGADGKWAVKPEFAATFGYLENEKAKATRAKKEGAPKYSSYEIAANYLRTMLNGQEL